MKCMIPSRKRQFPYQVAVIPTVYNVFNNNCPNIVSNLFKKMKLAKSDFCLPVLTISKTYLFLTY